MKKFVIYMLCDPRSGEIRYIGKSCSGLNRPRHHFIPSSLKHRSKKNSWIKSLLHLGIKPTIEIVEEFNSSDTLGEAEVFWISQFRALGFRLTNLTDGGEGLCGYVQSEETKKKRNQARGWYKHSLETRVRISESSRGKKMSQVSKLKSSILKGGKPFSDQHGNLYMTQGEAAQRLGLRQSHISEVLNGKLKSTGGYLFTYLDKE